MIVNFKPKLEIALRKSIKSDPDGLALVNSNEYVEFKYVLQMFLEAVPLELIHETSKNNNNKKTGINLNCLCSMRLGFT